MCFYFLPFLVFGIIPLMIMAALQDNAENWALGYYEELLYYITLAAFSLGTILQVYSEVIEILHECKNYFRNV
mgnify:CR=1 FL=1